MEQHSVSAPLSRKAFIQGAAALGVGACIGRSAWANTRDSNDSLLTQILGANGLNGNQVALLVSDLDAYVKRFNEVFGLGPWWMSVYNNDNTYMEYHGEPVTEDFEYRIGSVFMENVSIELIQPVKGPSCYADALGDQDAVMHHIVHNVESKEAFAEFTAAMEEAGYPALQHCVIGELELAYFDTQDDFGLILELVYADEDGGGIEYTLYPPESM